MKNFKYIRSTQKDINGKTIFSGQIVSTSRAIGTKVFYEPDFGFRILGDNFADTYDIKIEKDITIIQKVIGTIKFAIFNLTGK